MFQPRGKRGRRELEVFVPYSDLLPQYLCVLYNSEAVSRVRLPNRFSELVVALSVEHLKESNVR